MADTVEVAPAPGLPDILFAGTVGVVAPLVADSLSVLALLGPQPWGIYQGGVPIVVADTVLDFNYTKLFANSSYPVEGGSFASYNKVEMPFEGRVRFASGGSPDVRQALIDSIEGILGDLNLYDICTPDRVYINANLAREEYRRTNTEGGASLLMIDVSVQEVRILSGDTTGSNTADPASANQQNSGTVQATGANQAQTAALGGTPVTTSLPATLGGGVSGLPVTQPSAGIGSA